MDILRSINRDDGITVICNLHTIDTARAYCDRIIGMRTGQMIFDDHPKALDHDRIQEIYGATDGDDEIDENITSTSVAGRAPIDAMPMNDSVGSRCDAEAARRSEHESDQDFAVERWPRRFAASLLVVPGRRRRTGASSSRNSATACRRWKPRPQR